MVAFAYASALNTQEKLYIVLAFLIAGMIGYVVCELVDRSTPKVEHVDTEKAVQNPSFVKDEAEL